MRRRSHNAGPVPQFAVRATNTMTRIFISYSRKDLAFAQKLRDAPAVEAWARLKPPTAAEIPPVLADFLTLSVGKEERDREELFNREISQRNVIVFLPRVLRLLVAQHL